MVSLGIIAGIGCIGLPALVFTPTHSTPAPTTGTNSTSDYSTLGMSATPTTLNDRSNSTKTQSTPAGDTQVTPGSLVALISLIVAPAVGISLIVSVSTLKRSRGKRSNLLSENA